MRTKPLRLAEARRWAACLPGYALHGDRFLIKRSGPLVLGLCLEPGRDSRDYYPTSFAHNLLGRLEFPTIGYGQSLGSCRYGLTDVDEKCQRAAGVLESLDVGSFGEFVEFAKASFVAHPPFLPDLIWDVWSLAWASGSMARSEECLVRVLACAAGIGANWGPVGGIKAWSAGLRDAMQRADSQAVELVVRRLGFEDLPVTQLAATPVEFQDLDWVFMTA